MARQLRAEINGARAFHIGEMFTAIRDQLTSHRRCRLVIGRHLNRLDDGLDFLAEVFVGHTNHRHISDRFVHGEDVLGLLGVDVHPARDDHVRLAVSEIQEPILIDLADITERRPPVAEVRVGRLLLITVIFELSAALEVDRALIANAGLIAVVVTDVHDPRHREANGAGMS